MVFLRLEGSERTGSSWKVPFVLTVSGTIAYVPDRCVIKCDILLHQRHSTQQKRNVVEGRPMATAPCNCSSRTEKAAPGQHQGREGGVHEPGRDVECGRRPTDAGRLQAIAAAEQKRQHLNSTRVDRRARARERTS
eukprot:1150433-Pelagomonas_calceolata.AAC.3